MTTILFNIILNSYSKCAQDALEDMCSWLNDDCGEVAVYDATNSTFERRQLIYETVVEKYGYKLFFVESICNAPDIIEANIREVKVHSPDYRDMNKDSALTDFIQRIEHYKQSYQSLDEEKENEFSFIKIFNAGEKVLVHRHEGIKIFDFILMIINLMMIINLKFFKCRSYSIESRVLSYEYPFR